MLFCAWSACGFISIFPVLFERRVSILRNLLDMDPVTLAPSDRLRPLGSMPAGFFVDDFAVTFNFVFDLDTATASAVQALSLIPRLGNELELAVVVTL